MAEEILRSAVVTHFRVHQIRSVNSAKTRVHTIEKGYANKGGNYLPSFYIKKPAMQCDAENISHDSQFN